MFSGYPWFRRSYGTPVAGKRIVRFRSKKRLLLVFEYTPCFDYAFGGLKGLCDTFFSLLPIVIFNVSLHTTNFTFCLSHINKNVLKNKWATEGRTKTQWRACRIDRIMKEGVLKSDSSGTDILFRDIRCLHDWGHISTRGVDSVEQVKLMTVTSFHLTCCGQTTLSPFLSNELSPNYCLAPTVSVSVI